jgi:hypothetical protein
MTYSRENVPIAIAQGPSGDGCMFDPQAVINQARQDEIPEAWRVFHGKRPRPVYLGCFFAFLVLIIVTVCGALITIATLIVLTIRHAQITIGGFIPIAFSIILAIVLLAGVMGYRRGKKDAKDPDPLLVVTPEGFVEYFLNRHSLNAVSFSELENIRLLMNASFSRDRSLKNLRLQMELHYHDGRKERWKPKAMYDEEQDAITESIFTAFTQHLKPSRQPGWPELPKLPRKRRKR